MKTCDLCKGSGIIARLQADGRPVDEPCPECDGAGRMWDQADGMDARIANAERDLAAIAAGQQRASGGPATTAMAIACAALVLTDRLDGLIDELVAIRQLAEGNTERVTLR